MVHFVIEAEIAGQVQRLADVAVCYGSPKRLGLQDLQSVIDGRVIRDGKSVIGKIRARLERRLDDGTILVYEIGNNQPKSLEPAAR